jgi:SAM-dependent methyltransferase
MMNPAEFANIARAEEDFWWYRGMRRILFRLLDPVLRGRRLNRVLEAGCGTGYFARLAQRQFRWPLVPVDIGWEGLKYARAWGVERPVQADVAALPFAGNTFDLVLSLDVIVHFPRGLESGAVREMARVLRPGGILVVRSSALGILRSRHSEFAHERQRFTRARLRALVEQNGIRVLRATYANSLLLPVALAKFRIWEPLTKRPASSGVAPIAPWLNTLLGVPLAAEAACIGAGLDFPLGQSILLLGEKAG